jgi:hypothetical protein
MIAVLSVNPEIKTKETLIRKKKTEGEKMKKLLIIAICFFALVATASATPFPFPSGAYNAKYTNYEAFFQPGVDIAHATNANMLALNTPIAVNDVNIGVFVVSDIYPNGADSFSDTFSASGGAQGVITGVFTTTVVAVNGGEIDSNGGTLSLYYQAPGDPGFHNLQYLGVNIAASIASAMPAGDLMATFNFNNDMPGGYSVVGTLPAAQLTAAAGFLDVVLGSGPWAAFLDGNNVPNPTVTPLHPGSDIEEQSNISVNNNSNNPWVYQSQDPVQGTTVPEPGTLTLMGIGFIGLAGLGRKRFFQGK